MSYTSGTNINPATLKIETDLLRTGMSYTEIAAITGGRVKSISERNRLVYKIDIWEAFKGRIERDNIPNRLNVSDAFGHWFMGFFDGEGTITLFTRPCTGNPTYSEYRMNIRIQVRDDDAEAIHRIKNNLNIGRVSHYIRDHGATNPAIAWVVEDIKDLAEVVIPLFDRYPLYTKKAKEYTIWKPIVIQRYLTTLGGYSNRRSIPEEERLAFYHALEAIKKIRTYVRSGQEIISELT